MDWAATPVLPVASLIPSSSLLTLESSHNSQVAENLLHSKIFLVADTIYAKKRKGKITKLSADECS